MIFDSHLIWKQHVDHLKVSCGKLIGLIKTLAHQSWGANTNSLLSIYKSFIRSRIEYGLIAYGTCCKTAFKKVEIIENTALRTVFEAFGTTPVDSLYLTLMHQLFISCTTIQTTT